MPDWRKGQRRVTVSEWLPVVIDKVGVRQYVAKFGFTRAPANACRHATRDAALYDAYQAKEQHQWIADVDAEETVTRKWVKDSGTDER